MTDPKERAALEMFCYGRVTLRTRLRMWWVGRNPR